MGNTVTQSTMTDIVNEITAEAFVNVILECQLNTSLTQINTIDCGNNMLENSDVCRNCMTNIQRAQERTYLDERRLWASRDIRVRTDINEDYEKVRKAFISCLRVCKNCYIENLSQDVDTRVISTCKTETEIANALQTSVSDKIQQKLQSNRDVLSSFASILGAGTDNDVRNTIQNRIGTIIDTTLVGRIKNEVNYTSTIVIRGNNISANLITQRSAISSIVSFLTTNNVFNNALSQTEWEAIQALHNKQNTLDDLYKLVAVKTRALSFLNSLRRGILGNIIVFMLCVGGLLVLSVLILFIMYRVHLRDMRRAAEQRNLPQNTTRTDPSATASADATPSAPSASYG